MEKLTNQRKAEIFIELMHCDNPVALTNKILKNQGVDKIMVDIYDNNHDRIIGCMKAILSIAQSRGGKKTAQNKTPDERKAWSVKGNEIRRAKKAASKKVMSL